MNNERYNNNIFKLIDVCTPNNDGNIIISGLSIKMALAMLLNGATGQSEEELLSFLGKNKEELNLETSNRLKDSENNLKLANAYWFKIPNEINNEYREIIKEYQNAEINIDDFNLPTTLEKINNWVKNNTNGLIEQVLNRIDDLESILINTLYFKAQWSQPFNEYLTHNETFFGKDKTTEIKMMKTSTKNYFENEYAKGFNLYYENSPYEFIGILPNNEGSLNIEQLNLNNFNQKKGNYEVSINFPKLNIEYDNKLKNTLKSIGINAPFENINDFKSMLTIPQLVSEIIHKVNFKLDEKGTEATAATVILMSRCAAFPINEPTRINLIFNRPFAFIIRHIETKELLFIGKINNL